MPQAGGGLHAVSPLSELSNGFKSLCRADGGKCVLEWLNKNVGKIKSLWQLVKNNDILIYPVSMANTIFVKSWLQHTCPSGKAQKQHRGMLKLTTKRRDDADHDDNKARQ